MLAYTSCPRCLRKLTAHCANMRPRWGYGGCGWGNCEPCAITVHRKSGQVIPLFVPKRSYKINEPEVDPDV